MATIVRNKAELDEATRINVSEILVVGEFADKLYKSRKIASLSATALSAIIGVSGIAVAGSFFTRGLSMLAVAPVAALTGLEISFIILASSIGIAMIVAVFKDYELIEYNKGHLRLQKKMN